MLINNADYQDKSEVDHTSGGEKIHPLPYAIEIGTRKKADPE